MTGELEPAPQALSRIVVILDDQDAPARESVRRMSVGSDNGGLPFSDARKPHGEGAAATGSLAGGLDITSMQLGQPLDQGKPDAEASGRKLKAEIAAREEIEYPRHQMGGNAGAVVFYLDDRLRAVRFHDHAN